ncbi:hypothetical protein ACIBJI_30470 [Nocardia sp. NPDC050408]
MTIAPDQGDRMGAYKPEPGTAMASQTSATDMPRASRSSCRGAP